MKILALLSFLILTGCSSMAEQERQASLKSVKESFITFQSLQKDGYVECKGFFIKSNKIITTAHCLPDKTNMSYIQRTQIEPLDKVIVHDYPVDFIVIQTKNPNSMSQNFLVQDTKNTSNNFLIPVFKDKKMAFIKCTKINDPESLLNKLQCDHKIIKSMSGSPILTEKYEYTGVLYGFMKDDAKTAVYTLL